MNTHNVWRLFMPLAALVVALYLTLSAVRAMPSPQTGAPDLAAIDDYITAEMKAQRIPGLALGIVHGDQIVYLKGYGMADPSGRAVTPQTPFVLGSTTKSMTALAMMQLVEAGKVDLDAPVQRYLPWFRVADEGASSQITVRHLLNQTSGFSTATGRVMNVDFNMDDDALEQRVRGLSAVRLTQPVGAVYQYSNANYATLGLIVQTVSGQPFERYLQEHILAPLEMNHSFTSKQAAQQQGLAMGHRFWFGISAPYDEPFPRASLPQGFAISSAEDMAHYLVAQLNGGQYGAARTLSPAGMAEMHRPAAPIADSSNSYGMGWEVGPFNGAPAVWHDGDTFSFHSFIMLLPEEQWGVVVVSNASNLAGTARFQAMARNVTGMLVGRAPVAEGVYGELVVYAILLAIVLLQTAGIVRSVILLRRWRAEPHRRPRGLLRQVLALGLPLVLNLLWALLVLVWLPRTFAPLSALLLGAPGIGYTLLISGLVALGWGITRAALAFFVLRRASARAPAGAAAPVKT